MAEFHTCVTTTQGLNLIALSHVTKCPLVLTKMTIGDSRPTDTSATAISAMTKLVDEKLSSDITSLKKSRMQTPLMDAMLLSANLRIPRLRLASIFPRSAFLQKSSRHTIQILRGTAILAMKSCSATATPTRARRITCLARIRRWRRRKSASMSA